MNNGRHMMDIEKLIERLNNYSAEYQRHGRITAEAADALSILRDENAKLRNSRDRWRKCAEEFSSGVNQRDNETEKLQTEDEKLRAELKSKVDLVFQQIKELDRRNLLLREQEAELKQVKNERDAAIKDLSEIIGDIEETRCKYSINNIDVDNAFADLCRGYCANVGNFCYDKNEYYRCKRFKWRGPQKENI